MQADKLYFPRRHPKTMKYNVIEIIEIKSDVSQWLTETSSMSWFHMSDLQLSLIFFVQGMESSPSEFGAGCKQKDDVQTQDEGFPRIWFWENLTLSDRQEER